MDLEEIQEPKFRFLSRLARRSGRQIDAHDDYFFELGLDVAALGIEFIRAEALHDP